MSGRVSKVRGGNPRLKLKSLRDRLLDAVGNGRELSPQSELLSQGPTRELSREDPARELSRKRRFDATSEPDLSPLKKIRLGQADVKKQPEVVADLHQPKPSILQRGNAAFLRDFVDPVDPEAARSVDTFVSQWLDSVLGSGREKQCRSDSHLCRLNNNPLISRSKSAPEMSYTRDAEGFVVPPTPASSGPPSYRGGAANRSVALSLSDISGATPDSGRSPGRSLVEDPLYRSLNLAANNVFLRSSREQFPDHIANLIDRIRADRDSPAPSPDEVWQDTALEGLGMGAGEPKVEKYFQDRIFPDCGPGDILDRADRQPMAKHTVPSNSSKLKLSTPVPDMLYGYSRQGAFPQQQSQLISMGNTVVANNQGLIYPFFVVEFKGDGPSGVGSLWVATNQCLGGSTACVNIAERLKSQLRQYNSDDSPLVDTAAFSVAMSGTEARLYISWKHDELNYYMANIQSFLLQDPEHYLRFRKYIRNIIDWGKDKRLNEIRESLDVLLEESRKKSSDLAKARPPPSGGSATSSGKRRKSSSSRGSSELGQGGEASKTYWEWDGTIGRWFHRNVDGTLSWAEEEGQPSVVSAG